MAKPLSVLIVEDSESDAQLIVRLLQKADYKVAYQQVETAEEMRAALGKQTWDIVISDYSLPQFDGPHALTVLQEMKLDIPFIAVSGTIGEETAVTMMKAGAQDYLMKDNLTRLAPAVERELAQTKERRQRRKAEEELSRSRELLHQSFANLHDAIFIVDAGTLEIMDCNPAACEMSGYERSELLNRTTEFLYVDKTARAEFQKLRDQAIQESGFLYLSEFPMRRKDGTIFSTDHTASPLRDGDGRITGWVSVIRDISERKQAEEALRKSEQVLREAESLGHTGSWDQDLLTGKIFNTGENLHLFFGDDLSKGEPFDDYAQAVHPDDREFVLRNHALLLEGGPGDIEYRVVWPDGSVHVIFGRATVVRDEAGQAIRVYGTNVDITERKQAEESLRESESIFRGFLEQSVDAIMLADEQGVVIQWSKGAEVLTGYSRDESVGKSLWEVQFRSAPKEFKSTELYELIKANLQVVLLTGQGRILNSLTEAMIQRPDGSTRITQALAFPIKTHKGFMLGSILRDITERKQAEETIKLNEERFRTLYENSTLGMYRTTPDGRILLANPSLVKMLGYSSFDELSSRNLEQEGFEPSYSRSQFLEMMEKQGEVHGLESAWERLDGSIIFVRESARAIRDPDGKTLYYDGTVEDITERKQAEDALHVSEARFKGLFEDSPISLWEEDFSLVQQKLDTLREAGITNFEAYFNSHPEEVIEYASLIKVLDVNKATMRLYGADRKEDILRGIENIFEGEPGYVFRNELVSIAEGKTRFAWEGINKTLDGRLINLDLSWSVAPSYEKTLSRVIVSVIDITERKQVEKELQTSEAKYRTLVESSNSIIATIDHDGYFHFVNRIAALQFGSEPATIIGKHMNELFPPENAEIQLRHIRHVIENNEGISNEAITIVNGQKRWYLNNVQPVLDPAGRATLAMLISQDITDRKRAEAALAKSEQEYRTLFENMPIGLYRTTADGRLLDINQAMVEMFGYKDRASLLVVNAAELYVDPASDRKFKSEIERSGFVSNFEAEVKRADGSTFWTEDHNHVIRAEDGSSLFYEGSLVDITERKQAEQRIKQQLERLASLRTIDQVVTSSFDLHISLTMILNQVTRELGVDSAEILLLNSANLFLEYGAGVGFRTKAAEKASVRLGQEYAGRVALERQIVQIPNVDDQPDSLVLKTKLAGEDFKAYFGVPLIAKGVVRGVLEIYHRSPLNPDQEWLDFLSTLGDQAAIAVDNANLFDNLQRSNIDLTLAYDATIEGWSRAMDLRDKETEGHTQRVTEMTMELAGLFGIKDEDLVSIRRGALLHDIGKMGVPDAILLKPGSLTDEEWVIMRKHPELAFEMLSSIRYLKSAIDIPYCHHEKWDGTGYPRGLKGELIPLPARIFAIVDVWDAVTSDRPYRKAWTKDVAIEHLKSQAGKHFDPQVVSVCLESGVFDRKGWKQPSGYR